MPKSTGGSKRGGVKKPVAAADKSKSSVKEYGENKAGGVKRGGVVKRPTTSESAAASPSQSPSNGSPSTGGSPSTDGPKPGTSPDYRNRVEIDKVANDPYAKMKNLDDYYL